MAGAGGEGRIGVFGGTFDPVHHGHLIAAAELRDALGLDRVLLVPNADPPHKPDARLSPAVDRIAMLELAIEDRGWLGVDRVEVDRAGPSFTVETLRLLRDRRPERELVFLMGSDSLRDLPSWRAPGEIVRLARLGVATRPAVVLDEAAVYERVPEARGRVDIVRIPDIGISASEVRARVAAGRPIAFQVPFGVEQYIQATGLYRVRTESA